MSGNYTGIVNFTNKEQNYTLLDVEDTSKIPAGYEKTTVKIKKKKIPAWTKGNGSAFYLIYALDSNNNVGLYSYDNETKTLQRFNMVDYGGSEAVDAQNLEKLQKDYDTLKQDLSAKNSLKMKIIILMAVVVLLMIFIVINLILKIKDITSLDDQEYDNIKQKKKEEKRIRKEEKKRKIDIDEDEYYKESEDDSEDFVYEEEKIQIQDEVVTDRISRHSESQSDVEIQEVPREESEDIDDDFADLNIDLTDSILEELTRTSQELERSSQSTAKEKPVAGNKNAKSYDFEMPSFSTGNLPDVDSFKYDISDANDVEIDFEFFDLDEDE